MKDERIVIRCSKETLRVWRTYKALAEVKDSEEALLKLLKDSGWLTKVELVDMIKKGIHA